MNVTKMAAGHTTDIRMAAATDLGKVRETNEDYFFFSDQQHFFVVCDGMGGHNAGKLASQMAGQTLKEIVLQEKFLDLRKVCEDVADRVPAAALHLVAGVRMANRRLYNHALQHPENKGMGTTLVAGIIRNGWLYLVHVGDSRFYRLRNGTLDRLTRDHTWINELLEDREITEEEAKKFRKKNVLTRALGIAPAVKIDFRAEPVQEGDIFLLCTDGLYNALADELIQSLLAAEHGSLQKKADKLVSSAKLLDGSDNITSGLMQVARCPRIDTNQKPSGFTLPEPPDAINQHLDRMIKRLYQPAESPAAGRFGWPVWVGAAAAGVLLLLTSIFFLQRGSTQTPPEPKTAAAMDLLSDDMMADVEASARPQRPGKRAGVLVLLQAQDAEDLEALQYLNGIRVLDTIRKVREKPLYSGRYTWAVADSTHKVIYQNGNIRLVPRDSWPKPAVSPLPATDGNAAGTPKARALPRGRVFLVGNFQSSRFEKAKIYINEWPLGPLDKYLDKGFYLRPGRYDISLRDPDGTVLRLRRHVRIRSGKTIAVEF